MKVDIISFPLFKNLFFLKPNLGTSGAHANVYTCIHNQTVVSATSGSNKPILQRYTNMKIFFPVSGLLVYTECMSMSANCSSRQNSTALIG